MVGELWRAAWTRMRIFGCRMHAQPRALVRLPEPPHQRRLRHGVAALEQRDAEVDRLVRHRLVRALRDHRHQRRQPQAPCADTPTTAPAPESGVTQTATHWPGTLRDRNVAGTGLGDEQGGQYPGRIF